MGIHWVFAPDADVNNNPDNPYILVCDRPKVEALKAQFPELFEERGGK